MTTELAIKPEGQISVAVQALELLQREAKALSVCSLVPDHFKNIPDCMKIIEMAHRLGASALAVAQNIYFVHGKPGWSSQFIISCINSCGKFSDLRYEMAGEGDSLSCFAYCTHKATGEKLVGPPASINMAKKEGWFGKNGSKWQTMPELMLRYRAATFFGRLYCPDMLMGMSTRDEIEDMKPANAQVVKPDFGVEEEVE